MSSCENSVVQADPREIRPAATVIAARTGADGVEVLLLRRGSKSRFLPGYVVFPGGAVDEEDAELARRWFGSTDEAPRAAAVRELIEETGLAVTAAGVGPAGEADPLAAVGDRPPRSEDLHEISRWIAPEQVPVRFDARFFAVAAPRDISPRPDGDEAAEVWWGSPREIMRQWAAGECRLYWPTMKTMEALARCDTVEQLLALHVPQQEPGEGDEDGIPRSTFEQGA